VALIRLPEVIRQSGLSRSSVYHYIDEGLFPRPVKIGERAVAWISSEIAAVNEARIAGKSREELKSLVSKLQIARQGCA